MNFSPISFKGYVSYSTPDRRDDVSKQELLNYYDQKINSIQSQKQFALDVIEFLERPETKKELDKLPECSSISFIPDEDEPDTVQFAYELYEDIDEETQTKLDNGADYLRLEGRNINKFISWFNNLTEIVNGNKK